MGVYLIIRSIAQLRRVLNAARRCGQTIGFVPTMGYFHDGHLGLMRRAKKDNDLCVVSIYVNPKQFAPHEDFRRYPKDLRRDLALARKEKVDIIFLPSDNVIYPKGYLTTIDVEKLSRALCGKFRPGHFKGVATVVAKLLNIVQPHVLYLGQKDAQQAVVLKTMVRDLDLPVAVRVVPTVREKSGLAMSSRNVYLSADQRCRAAVLYRALKFSKARISAGERSAGSIVRSMTQMIRRQSGAKIQYVACVDAL
ncbi:MAG: pantoate--beta-alanine ligase, partial [Candidatus Omnitrophica bacterium]|nr:pantoate--beta-alanine ligase [Candidatus Omnitrophota bacterium]